MKIDYKKYPDNWKTEIRPDILSRAKNMCEFCNVPNYKRIFRGYIDSIEVYQDSDGRVFLADNSRYLSGMDHWDVEPSTGNPNQQSIKIVLTIAHLNHDVTDNIYSNLKALCQRCHNRHDSNYRAANRKKKQTQPTLF